MTPEQEKLVLNNVQLVYKIASKFVGLADYDDIVAEGMLGLCAAAINFDEIRGNSFGTFAYKYISGKCKNFISYNRTVKSRTIKGVYTPAEVVNLSTVLENSTPSIKDEFVLEEKFLLSQIQKKLTKEEYEILELLYNGYTRKEVIDILHIDSKSLTSIVSTIRYKLDIIGVRSKLWETKKLKTREIRKMQCQKNPEQKEYTDQE